MDPSLYRAVTTGTNLHLLTQNKDKLLSEVTGSRNTVLHVASQYGQLEAVKLILSLNRELLLKLNGRREYALHLAARGGHASVVRALIECTKEIPILKSPPRPLAGDIESCGALVEALDQAKYQMLRGLSFPMGRCTALHEAVRYHHIDIVKMLIEEDPDYSYSNSSKFYESPLYLAARRGFHELVSVILDKCKSPAFEGPDGKTALHGAVISNSKECVGLLLRWKPTLSQEKDKYEQTPLHYVAHLGYTDLVSQLLSVHPNSVSVVHARDESRNTALHIAAIRGHVSVMKEILLYSPDSWDMRGHNRQNILHMAVEHQQVDVIQYILQEDSQIIDKTQLVNQIDWHGNTPLHLLSVSDCFVPHELILDPIIDKGLANYKKMTALDLVTYNDESTAAKTKIVEELMGAGATSGLPYRISTNKKTNEEVLAEEMKKKAKTHIIVTTLVATITFAAGFTMPGRYIQSESSSHQDGMSVLTKSAAFQAFIVSDTIALLLSTTAIFMYFTASLEIFDMRIFQFLYAAVFLNLFALLAMMVAFVTGTYAVLRNSFALALAVCLVGSCFFLVYIPFLLIFLFDLFVYWRRGFSFM